MHSVTNPQYFFEYLKSIEKALKKHCVKNVDMYFHIRDDILMHQ